jgi:hypothetical protein
MEYNPKINTDGAYRKFYGYTVISNVKTNLEYIEEYIRNNDLLKEYFSPLPSCSYHMTIYNLWCNGSPLLPFQKRFIKKYFSTEKAKQLEYKSQHVGFFNPSGCIDGLVDKLHIKCKEEPWDNIELQISKVHYGVNTIHIIFTESPIFKQVNNIRNKITTICERYDGMGYYHITLAYKYKDTNKDIENKIINQVNILNMILEGKKIIMNRPNVYMFDNMTEFIVIKK